MNVTCAKCHNKIDSSHINVAKDTAYCPDCEHLASLSSLLNASLLTDFDISEPVKGAFFNDLGYRWTITCSHRSPASLFLIPFTLFWSGGSLTGIYGTQIMKGEFDLAQSLFGLPFLLGTVMLISVTLMTIFGRTLVSVENNQALIFIGVGSLGWYRRFDWRSITHVTETISGKQRHISLEGKDRMSLGWGMSNSKLYYLANVLRSKLHR